MAEMISTLETAAALMGGDDDALGGGASDGGLPAGLGEGGGLCRTGRDLSLQELGARP